MLPRTVLISMLAGLLAAFAAMPATAEYRLVWSDEFNGTELNSADWTRQVMPGADSGNFEMEYYTDRIENARLENGNLVIEGRSENYRDHKFTSARLNTKGKRDFLYGKIEARIKLPSAQGLWPAFWMMPTGDAYGTWAASGEIDIVESTNFPRDVFGTIHFGGAWPHNVYQGNRYAGPEGKPVGDFSQDFHTYTLEWQPYEIRWYVDGNLYSTQYKWRTDAAAYPAPFDKPFHLIVNLAIGGRMPGPPDAKTTWPQKMYMDWVRVYQSENRPPSLSIKSPAPDAILPSGKPAVLEAEGNDPDGGPVRVQFYNGDMLLGEVAKPPYRFEWPAKDGYYALRMRALDAEDFACNAEVDVIKGAGVPRTPFHDKAAAVPGKIEAEDFDKGMPKDAFWDTDKINHGNAYRKEEPVDIEYCVEGGFDVGWLEPGEYFNYTVDVAESATYDICFRVASEQGGGPFRLLVDHETALAPVHVPKTGNWQKFADVPVRNVPIAKGRHTMQVAVDGGQFNLDYFSVLPAGQTAARTMTGGPVDPLAFVLAAAGEDKVDKHCFGEKIRWFWDQFHGNVVSDWPEVAKMADDNLDLDQSGIPDKFELALAAAALCFSKEADRAFTANHDALKSLYGQGPWWGKPVALGLMCTVSEGFGNAAKKHDARLGGLDLKPYRNVRGEDVLSAQGDVDRDGIPNIEEYRKIGGATEK